MSGSPQGLWSALARAAKLQVRCDTARCLIVLGVLHDYTHVYSPPFSTKRGADVIHVLEEGGVVESGDWNTLLDKKDGRFGALWRAQGIEDSYEAGANGTAPTRDRMSGEEKKSEAKTVVGSPKAISAASSSGLSELAPREIIVSRSGVSANGQ